MNSRLFSWVGIITMLCFVVFSVMTSLWAGIELQPTFIPLPEHEFLRASYEANSAQLAWLGLDSVLIIGYVTIFAGLYAATNSRYSLLAKIGLGAAITGGTLDFIENSYLASIALGATSGADLSNQPILLLVAICYLKTVASGVALAFLGMAFMRTTKLQKALSGMMILAALGTIASAVMPSLAIPMNIPRIIVIALAVVYFWNLRTPSKSRTLHTE